MEETEGWEERRDPGEYNQHREEDFIPILKPRSSPLYDPLWEVCKDTEKRGPGLLRSSVTHQQATSSIILKCPLPSARLEGNERRHGQKGGAPVKAAIT